MQEAVSLGVAPHAQRLEDPEPAVGGGAPTDPDRDLLDAGVDHRAKHLAGPEGRGARRVPLLRRQARQPRGLGQLDDRPPAVARPQPARPHRAVDRVGGRDLVPVPAAGRLHGYERAFTAIREGRQQHTVMWPRPPPAVGDRPCDRDGRQRSLERIGCDQDRPLARSAAAHRRSFQKNVAAHGRPSGFSA